MRTKSIMLTATMAVFSPAYALNVEPLSVERGRALVANEFANGEFNTGSWGNDVSLLLPFQWLLPGKGAYTYLSLAEYRHSDGMAWDLRRIVGDRLVSAKYEWSPDVDVRFEPFQLFEIVYNDGSRDFAYHKERCERAYLPSGDAVALVSSTWYGLDVGTNAVPRKNLLPEGAATFFRDRRVKAIRNVVPLRYRGARADIAKEPTRAQKRLSDGVNAECAWMLDGVSRKKVAELHCRHIGRIMPSAVVTNAYVVAGDCNFDGVVDVYVSSDAERDGNGNFRWTLYIGRPGGFVSCAKPLSFNFPYRERVQISPTVCAAKEAFFRFDRIDMPPYVMPVVDDGGRLELWSYASATGTAQTFRKQKGMANAEYHICADMDGVGNVSMKDIFLIDSMLVSARRLSCETIAVSRQRWSGQ